MRETIPAGQPGYPGKIGLERGYFLQDTFLLPAGPNAYYATRLYAGTDLIDTVTIGTGWDRIDSERVVYERILTSVDTIWNETKDTVLEIYSESRREGITVFNGKERRVISGKLAYYDAFSSPLLKDGSIYYWGLKKNGQNPDYRVYAMKSDVLAERTEDANQKWKVDLSFRNAEKMASQEDQEFEKFLRRFFASKGFQSDHIDFPIQGHYTYLCDNAGDDVCKKDTVFAQDKAGWQYHEYGYGTHPAVQYRVKKERPKAGEYAERNCLLAELDQAETDFNLSLYFTPRGDSWRLVYLNYFDP